MFRSRCTRSSSLKSFPLCVCVCDFILWIFNLFFPSIRVLFWKLKMGIKTIKLYNFILPSHISPSQIFCIFFFVILSELQQEIKSTRIHLFNFFSALIWFKTVLYPVIWRFYLMIKDYYILFLYSIYFPFLDESLHFG